MDLKRSGSQPSQRPPAEHFTGTVRLDPLFQLARLEENLGAADVVLTSSDLGEIDEAAAKIQIQGARLPEAVLAQTGR